MNFLNNIKKYKFVILFIFILTVILAIYFILNLPKKTLDEIDETVSLEVVETKDIEPKEEFIKVDIKGAVLNPGVYELKIGSRVSDVINMSGLNKYADTSVINLSKLLKDEMVIVIYTKEEVKKMKTSEVKYVEKECICPEIKNDASIEKNDTLTEDDNKILTSKPTEDNKVSLNKATLEELITLSGIGESKAKIIIEYREKNNGFKNIEDIKNVSGIGETLYEKIKDSITI